MSAIEEIEDDDIMEITEDEETQIIQEEPEEQEDLPSLNGVDEAETLGQDELQNCKEDSNSLDYETNAVQSNELLDDDDVVEISDDDDADLVEDNGLVRDEDEEENLYETEEPVSRLQDKDCEVKEDDDLILEAIEDEEEEEEEEEAALIEDDDDVIELPEVDPLGGIGECQESESETVSVTKKVSDDTKTVVVESKNSSMKNGRQSEDTIVVNSTKSLAELANTKKDSKKEEPTLVIIDTNAILSGKGAIPLEKSALDRSALKSSSLHNRKNVTIPDDAFLIEAPSFIVPYVFEQKGEKDLQKKIDELKELVEKEEEMKRKEENAEDEKDTDYRDESGSKSSKQGSQSSPKKSSSTEDYFESPVGKLLMNIGINLVQEYVQYDLLKIQKKKAEKEKEKSRSNSVTIETQQSLISLRKNIEKSKENNEPFRFTTKKCELCNFKTESKLVMSGHLETPHMRNYSYRCNFCAYTTRIPHEVLFHMEAEHNVKARLERAPAIHQCPNCAFEDNSKGKLSRHLQGCTKRFRLEKNLEPPLDWDTPAKLPKLPKNKMMPAGNLAALGAFNNQPRNLPSYMPIAPKFMSGGSKVQLPPLMQAPKGKPMPGLVRSVGGKGFPTSSQINRGMVMGNMSVVQNSNSGFNNFNKQILQQIPGSQLSNSNVSGYLQKLGLAQPNPIGLQKGTSGLLRNRPSSSQPSISITPLPRQGNQGSSIQVTGNIHQRGQGGGPSKTSFVICEICDGYIKDLDQLRNHMQWIHKVKIHPKMIYNKPPLNCQKCQFRFFTDQGLERHLLGSHGLVTSSMQDAANRGQDSGRCPLCGKVYQWKLLAHVAKDHGVTLKPAHLSYKCTVCTATFGMYKLFENHVYSAHSVSKNGNANAAQRRINSNSMGQASRGAHLNQRSMSQVNHAGNSGTLKINDEITIIPQSSNKGIRSSVSITATQNPRRPVRGNKDEDGIQIIEIDDNPVKVSNGRSAIDFKGKLPISDSTLRKRNLEISVCGTDEEESFHQPFSKRQRIN